MAPGGLTEPVWSPDIPIDQWHDQCQAWQAQQAAVPLSKAARRARRLVTLTELAQSSDRNTAADATKALRKLAGRTTRDAKALKRQGKKSTERRLTKGAAIMKIATGPLTLVKSAPGVRVVSGVVADESLDQDGQRADYAWAKAALEKWFQTGANLRRDHAVKSIGRGVRLFTQDAQRRVVLIGHVTNKAAIRDIDAGVLQCWSWGAKSVPGNPIRLRKGQDGSEWIVGGSVIEVSLVDRGANLNSRISVMPAQEVA